jgi:hypothetical protein
MKKRPVLERGLLPLLDISILLLGFFIVLMAARSSAGRNEPKGVFAGEAFVLLEIVPPKEGDTFLVYRNDDRGQRVGKGVKPERAAELVRDSLAEAKGTAADWRVIVVCQFTDVFQAKGWTAVHTRALRDPLSRAGYRVVFLWG